MRLARLSVRPLADLGMSVFQNGDRVEVSASHHWARGAVGTIVQPPSPVRALSAGHVGIARSGPTRKGRASFYWVAFDQPQVDADGDGPYDAGEIEGRYLSSAKVG